MFYDLYNCRLLSNNLQVFWVAGLLEPGHPELHYSRIRVRPEVPSRAFRFDYIRKNGVEETAGSGAGDVQNVSVVVLAGALLATCLLRVSRAMGDNCPSRSAHGRAVVFSGSCVAVSTGNTNMKQNASPSTSPQSGRVGIFKGEIP